MDLQRRHQQKNEDEIKKEHKDRLKNIEIHFDQKAYTEYKKLKELTSQRKNPKTKPTYDQILNSINHSLNILKTNPYYGDLIPRKYIPKSLISMYGTDKILRIELVGYWRLLYTLIGEEIRIIAFILEFMDHKKYNKLFKYKKK